MRALVVNCSAPHYNLGAAKLANWLRRQGHDVTEWAGDPGVFGGGFGLVALSVIFSWHAPLAAELALRFKVDCDVWCGGPGMAHLVTWWRDRTGLPCTVGLDQRFEREPGEYRMCFSSRGCPVGCWFCIVPKIEGSKFTLYPDFQPAPILCDNNLSALPVEHQERILERYRETGTRLSDANSGFEPRAFDEGTYERWRHQLRGPWRFAYDELSEAADVERMMKILAPVRSRMKQVYVLAGNEPVVDCYRRAWDVIRWGGEPWVQYLRPLGWLGDPKTLVHRHDWTEQLAVDFRRYFSRRLWKAIPLAEYLPRQNEAPPFAGYDTRRAVAR